MSRGKKRRKGKLKEKRLKEKMKGKLVRFDLQNSPKKYQGFSDKYCYQTNIHCLKYMETSFSNVRFQDSNITGCNYKGSRFNGVDFCNTNLKGTSFRNVTFRNVLFLTVILRKQISRGRNFIIHTL